MSNRSRIPMEQPHLRGLVNAALDYLLATHGEIVIVIIKDWLKAKIKV